MQPARATSEERSIASHKGDVLVAAANSPHTTRDRNLTPGIRWRAEKTGCDTCDYGAIFWRVM